MIFRLPRFEIDQALLLTTSSVVTASLASFTLGVVMIIVVIGESKNTICHIGVGWGGGYG